MINSELLEIMAPACAAGVMIALTHAPLGLEVMRRGVIFIDLAIAQFAGLGVVAAGEFTEEPSWWVIQLAALGSALTAAFAFRLVERITPDEQEAVIGSSFVLAASASLLILADRPHGGQDIQHLLSGQILFVTWRDVTHHAPVYVCILALWFGRPALARHGNWFFILFAVAITSSVQLVGVYVVFASLILPALAAARCDHKHLVAWVCGLTSVVLGITASTALDSPTGPVVVLAYAIVAISIRLLNFSMTKN